MANSSKRPALYVLNPYHSDAEDHLKQSNDIELVLSSDPRMSQWREKADAILVRSDTQITAADMKACAKLKHIVKQGAGVDNVDLGGAKEAGIGVYNTPGVNAEAVAELTLALALSVARRVSEIDRDVREGKRIIRSQMLGKSLHGKTLGVVGMGNIGLVLARKWKGAMEGSVIGFDPYADESKTGGIITRVQTLDELLGQSDVVSLHVPLIDSTSNLISTREFDLMRQGAILLNCARGGIVDEKALAQALSSGKLYGAGLDAMEVEPPTLETYGDLLRGSPNLIMTPHIGASTSEMQSLSGLTAAGMTLALLRGETITTGNRVV